jgi:hypothetical protein
VTRSNNWPKDQDKEKFKMPAYPTIKLGLSVLAFSLFATMSARAQAEINPDHFDDPPTPSVEKKHAATTHANKTADPNVSQGAQSTPATQAKLTRPVSLPNPAATETAGSRQNTHRAPLQPRKHSNSASRVNDHDRS